MMGFLYNNPFFLPGYREITVPKVLLMPEDMVNWTDNPRAQPKGYQSS